MAHEGMTKRRDEGGIPPRCNREPVPFQSGRLILGGVFLAVAGILAFFAFADPTQLDYYPACPLHSATGLYCPTCGGSRALHALLHGQWQIALDRNAFLVGAIPFTGAYLIAHCLRYRWMGRSPEFPKSFVLISVIVLALFGIARNLPIASLSELAP